MKKVIFIILIFLGLTACTNSVYILLDNEECCTIEHGELTPEYWANFNNSRAALKEVWPYFRTGVREYKDNFGGHFIDRNGFFNINFVGRSSPVESDYLIFHRVTHSYNFLSEIKDVIVEFMEDFGIWELAVCISCNRVSIVMECENMIPLILNLLRSEGLLRRNTLVILVYEFDFL